MDGCLIEGGREGREGRGRMEDGRYHCRVRCDMVGLMGTRYEEKKKKMMMIMIITRL